MANYSRNRSIVEYLPYVSLSQLSKLGGLVDGVRSCLDLDLFVGNKSIGLISCFSALDSVRPYISLSWINGSGKQSTNTIHLQAKESNLSKSNHVPEKSIVWYFICPITRKSCRKLYLFEGQFLSINAIPALYKDQTISKYGRLVLKVIGGEYKEKELIDILKKIQSPNYKRFYRGKISKTFANDLKKIEKIDLGIERCGNILNQPEIRVKRTKKGFVVKTISANDSDHLKNWGQ